MAQYLNDEKGNNVRKNGEDIMSAVVSGVVKGVDLEKRTMSMVGTSEAKDRDNDIIMLSGWDLKNYKKNPVFLWAHNYHAVPLAKTTRIIKTEEPKQLIHTIKYPTLGLNPFADMILGLYNEKIMNASSVGFIPRKSERLEKEKDERWAGTRFLKQEMLELSGVPVPSNPEALQNAIGNKSFGSHTNDMIKYMLGDTEIDSHQFINPNEYDYVMEELECKDIEIEGGGRVVWQVGETIDNSDVKPKTLPISGESEWSSADAIKELTDISGDDKKDLDYDMYSQGFAYSNPEKSDTIDGYKIPFARVIDGEIKATWGGVNSAMGLILSSKSNLNEDDRKTAYDFLKTYYKEFGKPAPDFKEIKSFTHYVAVDGEQKEISNIECKTTVTVGDDGIIYETEQTADAEKYWLIDMVKELELKAGAVLSKKNKDKLTQASLLVSDVLKEAEKEDATPPESQDEKTLDDLQDDVYRVILTPKGSDDSIKKETGDDDRTTKIKNLTEQINKLVEITKGFTE